MKRFIILALSLIAVTSLDAQVIKDYAAYQFNMDRALWYNSSSAAGIARDHIAPWRNVVAGYGIENGKFTDSWGSQSQLSLSLGGDMLMNVSGFRIAAGLSLESNRLGKSHYNTALYDVTWDMPYFAAVNTDMSFLWRQSHAVVDIKAATPLFINDMFSAGLAFKMDMKGASKSADPSCRYRGMNLEIAPSLTVAVNEENIVGLTAAYRMNPARSAVSSDNPNSSVLFLTGLGDYTVKWMGDDLTLGPMEYTGTSVGAALQYNHISELSDWLLELSFDKWETSVVEEDVQRGRVDKFITGFSATGLFGERRNRKFSFNVDYNLFYWLQGANNTAVANNGAVDANLDYTLYTGVRRRSFDWMMGLGMDMSLLALKKANPWTSVDSKLGSTNLLPYAFLGKNISIAPGHSLLAKLKMGYNFSMNNYFKYGGADSEGNLIVNSMLDDELDYLGSYFVHSGFSADYTYRFNEMMSAYASLGGTLLSPMGSKQSRGILTIKVGLLF